MALLLWIGFVLILNQDHTGLRVRIPQAIYALNSVLVVVYASLAALWLVDNGETCRQDSLYVYNIILADIIVDVATVGLPACIVAPVALAAYPVRSGELPGDESDEEERNINNRIQKFLQREKNRARHSKYRTQKSETETLNHYSSTIDFSRHEHSRHRPDEGQRGSNHSTFHREVDEGDMKMQAHNNTSRSYNIKVDADVSLNFGRKAQRYHYRRQSRQGGSFSKGPRSHSGLAHTNSSASSSLSPSQILDERGRESHKPHVNNTYAKQHQHQHQHQLQIQHRQRQKQSYTSSRKTRSNVYHQHTMHPAHRSSPTSPINTTRVNTNLSPVSFFDAGRCQSGKTATTGKVNYNAPIDGKEGNSAIVRCKTLRAHTDRKNIRTNGDNTLTSNSNIQSYSNNYNGSVGEHNAINNEIQE